MNKKDDVVEIRYIKSFKAKLSQSSQEVKDYYNEIKNHVLSYKRANSRISWHYDTINIGRDLILRFAVRGKTLTIYFALNEVDRKYKVEKTSARKFLDTPTIYRIKNKRRCAYAKELVDIIMRKLHIEKGKVSKEDFAFKYESTETLLQKGLIRENKIIIS